MPTQAQIAEALRLARKNGLNIVKEETIKPTTSGNTPGMTANDPRSQYAMRMYRMPDSADPQMYPESLDDLQDAHDRLSFVTGLECGPTTMEARKRWGNDIVKEAKALQEAGASISNKNMQHLLKAHDAIAKCLGATCQGAASANTPQEKLLRQHQQTMQQMHETHNQRMQELQQLIQQQNKKPYYRPGDYLKEHVRTMDRAELLDRSRPWPEWIDVSENKQDLEKLLSELQVEYLGLYDAVYGLTPEGPTRLFR